MAYILFKPKQLRFMKKSAAFLIGIVTFIIPFTGKSQAGKDFTTRGFTEFGIQGGMSGYRGDLGPEGGDGGGKILFEGTPENLVKVKASHTGRYLKAELK